MKHLFSGLIRFFNRDYEKEMIVKYLSDSSDLCDLERRMKQIDLGNAPFQTRGGFISRGYHL